MTVQFTTNKDGISVSNMETSTYRVTDIYVDYYTNYIPYSASSTPGDKTYTMEVQSSSQYYSTTISAEDLCNKIGIPSLNNGVFYVWMVYKDTSGTPGEDKIYLGVLVDYDPLYNAGMKLLANYYNSEPCTVPKNLEEFCILWEAVKLCVQTENWPLLNNIWGKNVGRAGVDLSCGCNQ